MIRVRALLASATTLTYQSKFVGCRQYDASLYSDNLRVVEEEAKINTDKLAFGKASMRVMKRFRVDIHGGECCPMCCRPFQGSEKQQALQNMDSQINAIPQQVRRTPCSRKL